MNDALTEAISRVIDERINEVNTMVPGTLVSYDPATNRAVVKPSIPKRLADGSELAAPQIVSVPVKWAGGAGGALTFPLKPGDPVELRFSQRSLDNWLSNVDRSADDPRSHDLTDAVCDPGLGPVGISGDQTGVVLRYGSVSIKLTENEIILTTAGGTLTLAADGIATASQDVKAQTVSLKDHVHINTQPGMGTSGIPQA